jgi:type II secretory pathway pseudopilin PulG
VKVALVVLAAALPAAVSATNGIPEQSEARRLSQRSRQLEQALADLRREAAEVIARIDDVAGSPQDPGGWTLESLALADRCATLMAEDVSEWSVLYGKQMPET